MIGHVGLVETDQGADLLAGDDHLIAADHEAALFELKKGDGRTAVDRGAGPGVSLVGQLKLVYFGGADAAGPGVDEFQAALFLGAGEYRDDSPFHSRARSNVGLCTGPFSTGVGVSAPFLLFIIAHSSLLCVVF